jgi:membrane protein DedA with SNARE-associated domain
MGIVSQHLAELSRHGYLLLFVWITAEQLGAPVPAVPILIAAGVLSGTGQLSLPIALALGIVACLIGDSLWFTLGKSRGSAVLRTLCRISLEPETCVRRSSRFISRFGNRSLWFAKFIPGVSTVAVPLAANSGVTPVAFAWNDALGSALYCGAYLLLGRLIGDRIDRLNVLAASIKAASVGFAIVGAVAIVGFRLYERHSFRREVRTARIRPHELRALIDSGSAPFIVDLRHAVDMLADPRVLPGAVRFTPDELAARHDQIPRDREIILYCT